MCLLVGKEGSSIVASHLIYTCAERGRTVVVANDDVWVGIEAALEIRSYWSDEDKEEILVGGMNAYLCASAYEEWTDV